MEKYRRVKNEKKEEGGSTDEQEIRVSAAGRTGHYVSYAGKVFKELGHKYVVIKATGQAIPTAVTAAEIIKRRIKDLHQSTTVGSNEVEDKYEPIEEGLEEIKQTRRVTYVEIKLSLEKLDESACGYQPPLPHSEVMEVDDMKVAPKRERADDDEDEDDEDDEDDDEDKPKRKKGSKGKGRSSKGKGKKGKKGKGKGKKGKGKDE